MGHLPDPVSEAIEKEMEAFKAWIRDLKRGSISPTMALELLERAASRLTTISYARGVEDSAKLVVGWRERDWPEGFDRHTAQIIADDFKNRLTPHKDTV
mgnify:CR=1 FL=1